MDNQTDLATVNPRTGNIIYEHIVEAPDRSRVAYLDENRDFKLPENQSEYKYIYTAFGYPQRCEIYLSQGITVFPDKSVLSQ